MRLLELGNAIFVSQRQADVVQTVQQAVATERFDFEFLRPTKFIADGACFEIDRKPIGGMLRGAAKQLINVGVGQPDWQHSVFEAVVVKNVGEARRDQNAITKIGQGPGRMFSARPAAEVPPREQHARAASSGRFNSKSGFSDPS